MMQDVQAESEEGDLDHEPLLLCAIVPVWLLCVVTLAVVGIGLLLFPISSFTLIKDGYLFRICYENTPI